MKHSFIRIAAVTFCVIASPALSQGYGQQPSAYQEQQYQQQPGYPQQHQSQPPLCRDCGTVESMREVEKKGDGTGLGAVAGGLTGLIVGKQLVNGVLQADIQ